MQLANAVKRPLLSMFLGLCLGSTWPTIASSQEIRIITFGDSLTAGLKRDTRENVTCPSGVSREPGRFIVDNGGGNEDNEDGEDAEEPEVMFGCYGNGALNVGGYQPNLVNAIEAQGYTPLISNQGFSGINTSQMLGIRGTVLSSLSGAEYVLIMAGANDAVLGISRSTLISNISVLVQDVRNRGMVPILATTTRNTRSPVFDITTGLYASDIRDYAEDNEVLLADARAAMVPDWDDFHSGDRLHLGTLGDQTLADVYFDVLDSIRFGSGQSSLIIAPVIMLLLDDES